MRTKNFLNRSPQVALGLTLILLTFSNCSSDPCKDITCAHGSCINGECQCESGWKGADCATYDCLAACLHGGACNNNVCDCSNTLYEGENCAVCSAVKFRGTYNMVETSNSGQRSFVVTIPPSIADCYVDLELNGFPNLMPGNNTRNVGRIRYQDKSKFDLVVFYMNVPGVVGEGSINSLNTVINLTYSYSDSLGTHNCTATMTKQ